MSTKLKKFLERFFLIDDSPHKIAAGAALGMFLGIIPGVGIIATIFFASLFRFNRLAATASVLAVNFWLPVIILPLAAALGGFIFNVNTEILISNFKNNYNLGWKSFLEESILISFLLPLLAGFIIVAGIISLAFYFLLYYLLKNEKIKLK